MPPLASLLQFAVASLLLALTPGPSVVLVVANGTDGGARAGTTTSLGLALGTATWGVVTAAGLGSLFARRPDTLAGVTAIGGLYLLWLAVGRFRATRQGVEVRRPDAATGRYFRDGLVVNLLNPSITLFLAALIPPFLAPDGSPVWQQVLALSGVLVLTSTVVNIGWGIAGAAVGRRARAWVGDTRTTIVVGVAYAALGVLALLSAAARAS